jgi:hypothetical protein
MEDNFFNSLDRLEYIAFFAGYPLIYTLIRSLSSRLPYLHHLKIKGAELLPYSYAMVGTLYLGLQLRNLFPDYSMEHIMMTVQHPMLKCWALLSLMCWIPAVARLKGLSLALSSVFFILWIKDIMVEQFINPVRDVLVIRNEMKIYTDSLLLNLGAYSIVFLCFIVFKRFRF